MAIETTAHGADGEEKPLRVRWENLAKNRYYEAILDLDIFGGWTLTRVWGRRGSPMGGIRHDPQPSYADAAESLAAIQATRRRHGYSVVSGALPQKNPKPPAMRKCGKRATLGPPDNAIPQQNRQNESVRKRQDPPLRRLRSGGGGAIRQDRPKAPEAFDARSGRTRQP